MTNIEKGLIKSIKNKIKKYKINISLNELLQKASGKFIYTRYNTKQKEVVDTGIEKTLCTISCEYFLSKYAFIDFPGVGTIPFKLYYYQKEILKDCEIYKKLVFNKVRQCGISTLFALYSFWKANFYKSEYIDVISIKQLKSQQFVAKINSTRHALPSFLSTPTIKDNQQEISFINGSKIISESQALTAGRSDSLSLLILDEAAHYQSESMIRGIVSAAAPTLSRTNGQMLVISTPNRTTGAGSYFYEQVQDLQINQDPKEKLIIIDYWEVPDEDYIEGAKKGYNLELSNYIKKDYYNNTKIKDAANKFFMPIAENNFKTNPWLKKQHDDLGDILYKQEILHSFIVSGASVFTDETFKRLKSKIKDPIIKDKFEERNLPGLWIWETPKENKKYFLGVDIATGTGDDYSSIQIFDEKLNQCAEYKGKITTNNLSFYLKELAKYYNRGFVIIESNSIGEAVFNDLYYSETEPYENMYKQKKAKAGLERITGWITDVKSRKLMVNELIDYFSSEVLFNSINIYSKRIYLEALSFIWSGNKAVHEKGSHDDTLIAFALILYLHNKITFDNELALFIDGKTDTTISFKSETKQKWEQEELDKKYKETFGYDKETYDWLVGRG